MASTQAKILRDLLLELLATYDTTLDLSPGSNLYNSVVVPMYNAVSPDILEEDIGEYIIQVLQEEYPSLNLQDGDLIIDLLVRPLQILLEPVKRELNLMRFRQSASYPEQMTLEDAEDLAANFFVVRKGGNRARGTVRIFLERPVFLTLNDQLRFSTDSGLVFVPAAMGFIGVDVISSQRVGDFFFADVEVLAEAEGEKYNVNAYEITTISGINNYIRVFNPFSMTSGVNSETKQELLARVQKSLTERSLVSRKAITARLIDEIADIVNMQIIGYGDPEMERDVLVGEGDGKLLASGMSLIFGRYVFMITGYEDTSGGFELPRRGDKVKLNFWKFIYEKASVETNEIQEIIYSSYGDIENIPTVHIFLLKSTPTQTQPVTGAVPGFLPSVFISIFGGATITVSGLPANRFNTDSAFPIEIASNKVHLGGKYDVWVRTKNTTTESTDITTVKTPYIDRRMLLFTEGDVPEDLVGAHPLNRIGIPYRLEVNQAFSEREVVFANTSQTTGYISKIEDNGRTLVITNLTGTFKTGEEIIGVSSGTSADIIRIPGAFKPIPEDIGSAITRSNGVSYVIIDIDFPYFIVDRDIDTTEHDIEFYQHRKTAIKNIFNPEFKIFPENAEYAGGLQSYIGKSTVTVPYNLTEYRVSSSDSLDIMEGSDRGSYTINSINQISPNKTELVIDRQLSRTNSDVKFRIIRSFTPVLAPMMRIAANGVTTSNGGVVPYKKPVGAYSLGAFSGTRGKYEGINGFVLPNFPPNFKGSGMLLNDSNMVVLDPNGVAAQFENTFYDDCISNGCSPCDSLGVTCSVVIDSAPTQASPSNVHFYISGLVSTQAKSYLNALRAWIKSLIDTFFRGVNSQNQSIADDLDAFIDAFAPIYLGVPPDATKIVAQFELCFPEEVFDGCNNTYIAIPEVDWDSEFESVNTFEQAITRFLAGTMRTQKTALSYAKDGDCLHIIDGANAGEYVIHKVLNIPWYNGDSARIQSTNNNNNNQGNTYSLIKENAYTLTVVIIKGEFPVEPLKGSASYFTASVPDIASVLPPMPVDIQNMQVRYVSGPNTGDLVNPFDVIEEGYSVLFKALNAQGVDLPDELSIDPSNTLQTLIKSFFSMYAVGSRSAQQTMRMLFQDPIDVTAYSPRACSALSWKKAENDSPYIEGQLVVLPLSDLGGKTAEVSTTIDLSQQAKVFSAVLPASAGTVLDIRDLAAILQEELDPSNTFLRITGHRYNAPNYWAVQNTGPESYSFGYIAVKQLKGGRGAFLEVKADSFDDAFGCLGFSSATRGAVPEWYLYKETGIPQYPFNRIFYYDNPAFFGITVNRSLGISHSRWFWIKFAPVSIPGVDVGDGLTLKLRLGSNTADYTIIAGNVIAYGDRGSHSYILIVSWYDIDVSLHTTGVDAYDPIFIVGGATVTTTFASNTNDILFKLSSGTLGISGDPTGLRYTTVQCDGYTIAGMDAVLSSSSTLSSWYTGPNSFDTVYASATLKATYGVENGKPVQTIELISPAGVDIMAQHTDSYEVDTTAQAHGVAQTTVDGNKVILNGGTLHSTGFDIGDQSFAEITEKSELLEYIEALRPTTSIPGFTSLEGLIRLTRKLNSLSESTRSVQFFIKEKTYLERWIYVRGQNSATPFRLSMQNKTKSNLNVGTILDHFSEGLQDTNAPNAPASKYDAGVIINTNNSVSTSMASGQSILASTTTKRILRPHLGSRFSITQGSQERQFVVDILDNEDIYTSILPSSNTRLDFANLPRDATFSAHFTDAQSCYMYFSDNENIAPVEAGVRPGDMVYLYEQVQTLSPINLTNNPFLEKKDRVLHVRYDRINKHVNLLTTSGTFLTPESSSALTSSNIPEEDVVKIGDYVCFEDSGEFSKILNVRDRRLVLETPINLRTEQDIKSDGKDGVIYTDSAEFRSIAYTFSSSDVGKYLVIYGSQNVGIDGTYDIDSVSNGVATLSVTFTVSEADLHWAVVVPDFSDIGDSNINGYSSTIGLTPIRIYRGMPSKFIVGDYYKGLNNSSAFLEILYGKSDGGPRRGVKQPYEVLRALEHRMTAQQMLAQGKKEGLYYMDLPCTSLSPTFDLNVPENTQTTPVVRTFKTSGYELIVHNRPEAYSVRERCELLMDSAVIPYSLVGSYSNSVCTENTTVTITYETSPTLVDIQTFLDSDDNRNLCSDPLVKHFLPSYVYMEVLGATPSEDASNSISSYINGLSPTASIQLSRLERELHYSGISEYEHPIFINCLTHDLNRDIILTRTDNIVDDTSILHDGTNRITYFIASTDTIKVGESIQ